jgi:hypothetical protein
MIRSSFLLLATAASLLAQVNTQPRLGKGQRFQIELTNASEAGANKSSATSIINLQGTRVAWTLVDTKVDPQLLANPMVKATLDASKGFRLEAQLARDGHFERVINEDEVKRHIQKSVTSVSNEIAKSIADPAKQKQFREMATKAIPADQYIESSARDLVTLFGLAGSGVLEGKPVKINVKSPHPLGAGPIDSVMTLTVTKVDRARKEYQVRTTEQYDSKSMATATEAMLTKSGMVKDKNVKLPKLDVVDTVDYTVDSVSGVPKTIFHKRVITSDGKPMRTDTRQFVVKRS